MNDKPQQQSTDSPSAASPALDHQLTKALPEDQQSFLESFWEAGQDVVKTAVELGEAAAKQTQRIVGQATLEAGLFANRLGDIWLLRKLAGG